MKRQRPSKPRCKPKPSLRELVTILSLKLDRLATGLGRKLEKIMSKLTAVATDLKTANEQLLLMRKGITNIGKDMAKLIEQAKDAETDEEKAAVDAEFTALKTTLGEMGADVAAIDAVVETPEEPQP